MAIRVICAEDSYREKDFAETQVILKTILDYANAIKKVGECALNVGRMFVYGVFTLTETETEKYIACMKLYRGIYTDLWCVNID